MSIFTSNEVVRVGDAFGTVVCSLDMRRDEVTESDGGAVVLLFPPFRERNDNGLRDVAYSDLRKQYGDI